jgi:hypothetical protein
MTVEAPVSLEQSDSDERTGAPEGGSTEETGKNPNAEAAKYRVRAREAEAARDTLAQRIKSLQTRELERIAAKSLSNPADLLTLSGKSLKDFIGDDGELVTETANELLGSRPGLRPVQAATDPTQGRHGGTGKPAPTWSELLK